MATTTKTLNSKEERIDQRTCEGDNGGGRTKTTESARKTRHPTNQPVNITIQHGLNSSKSSVMDCAMDCLIYAPHPILIASSFLFFRHNRTHSLPVLQSFWTGRLDQCSFPMDIALCDEWFWSWRWWWSETFSLFNVFRTSDKRFNWNRMAIVQYGLIHSK